MSCVGDPDLILVRTSMPGEGWFSFSESLGLGYVAAALRQQGFEVEIIDGQLDDIDTPGIARRILDADPAAVGFSIVLDMYNDVQDIVRRLRGEAYRGHVTVGQHFATFNADRILRDNPRIDSVVRFEGESTSAALMRAVTEGRALDDILGITYRSPNGEVITNPIRPLLEDLDSLPFPARDLLARSPERITTYNISGSRGCPWRCKFCTVASFYKLPEGRIWRHRSPSRIVDEIQGIVETYGPKPFNFVDDQFMGSGQVGREFARALASEILDRNLDVRFALETRADTVDRTSFDRLRAAGLRMVFLGIESAYQPTLDFFQKDITVEKNLGAVRLLQELDLEIQMGFIMFHKGTTLEEISANLRFLAETDKAVDALQFFNELIVHSGSEFMDEVKDPELNEAYESTWVIENLQARQFKDRLRHVLLPLTIPAQQIRLARRFGSLTPREASELESPIRRSFLAIAKRLLVATQSGSVGTSILEDMRRHCDETATRIQTSMRVRELTQTSSPSDLRANWLAES